MQLGGPGFRIVERARDAIARHRMLPRGETAVVALSGGPDSTCLLDVLARLGESLELDLAVAHVDHGLTPSSEEVAAEVARRAAAEGHDVHVVRAPDLAGSNVQARARTFRYEFLETVAANTGATRIATGHTLDDRVETTLARLLHGAGTRGVAGLLPVDGKRVRPLIEIRRSETRAYCLERGLQFFDDPANEDDRFERVAVRRRLVDAIEERWGHGAIEAMATSAQRLWEDAETLDGLADTLYQQLAKRTESGVRFDKAALEGVPRALRRRLFERAMGRLRDRSGGIDEALDALDRDPAFTGRFDAVGGIQIVVSSDHVSIDPGAPEPVADPDYT